MEILKISSTISRMDALMSDKFVVSTNEIGEIIVTDAETDRVYRYDNLGNFLGLIRLMNELQTTIQKQQEENKDLYYRLCDIEEKYSRIPESIREVWE